MLSLRATKGSVPARRSAFRHAGVSIQRSCCEGEARGNPTQSVILSEAKNLVEILRALPSG